MTPTVPDTTYNAHFHDYPFQRNDVNGSWLGMAGSPVQPYNWFLRRSREGVDFYDAQESWSYSHATLPHYNTKVPYTELAYFGTLFASREKESDNLHIFPTQNITPAFNFALLFDRYGGEGILENETTANKTAVVQANYLGKRYTAHAGYIYNMVKRGENGGIQDIGMIRDTTVEARDIRVNLTNASSQIKKNTFFLDQQLRIPFTFIEKMRARRDSTYSFDADSLNRDITTAYIGHSSELSTYTRNYEDYIQDEAGTDFYGGVFRYGPQTADSMRVLNLDNKVYLRLQPWAEDGAVSRLDIGVGDRLRQYFDSSAVRPTTHSENSFYLYGGAEGRLFKTAWWDAKARFVLLGHGMGDFDIEANAGFRFYPFRRARKSPVTVDAHFDSVLEEPTWYQRHLNLNHFSWDNEFGKITTTRFQGHVDIPRWRMSADVGYALLGGNIYYDTKGIVRQNTSAMSVLSATLRKEFKLGPVHLDHRALFQYSSKPEVLPLPMVALNFRYYLEFVVQRNERRQNVLTMQIGADAYWNTPWNSPAWNPNLGVFHNQDERSYTNGPWFDIFINMQWKRACVFIKYQNAGMGWPLLHPDYFSADRYAITESGLATIRQQPARRRHLFRRRRPARHRKYPETLKRQTMTRRERICLLAAAVLLAATGLASLLRRAPETRVKPDHIRGILELAPLADTSKALVIGYHYHLLQRFAAANGQTVDIRLTGRDLSYLDSLRAGTVDIVVVPFDESLAPDSVLVSSPLDSMSVWLMRHDEHEGMKEANEWIAEWHASAEYAPTRDAFLNRYNVFRSGPRAQISPYDSLIRAHADSLGWDWHLLAAVIYSESRFHIEARSRRGAVGLMQMMPKTAARYGVTDPLDPEMNIAAGAQHLGYLINRYWRVADNMTERYKYALAAYNAGIGRIDDCISLARHLGVDPSYWINIQTQVLPLMSDESILETGAVKLGTFRGGETMGYVDSIIAVYNRLCKICP